MPVFRNVNPNRQSGRLGNRTPVIYGEDWPTGGRINYLLSGGHWIAPSLGVQLQPSRRHHHILSLSAIVLIPILVNRSPDPTPLPSNVNHQQSMPRLLPSGNNGCASTGEGQQNELSKQAGKVWNKMTEEERNPFIVQAKNEKKWHQAIYPHYTHCPGRGAAGRMGKSVIKNISRPKRKMSATSSSTSESTFPEDPLTVHARRPVPMFPTSENLELVYPEPDTSATYVPTTDWAPKIDALAEKNALVRTVGIPVVESALTKTEEPEPQFDFTMQPPHLDSIPEQSGFKYHYDSTAMLAYLPPIPNTNDDMGALEICRHCSPNFLVFLLILLPYA
ncbi:hypothetical protein BYT27DRAFT_7262778 [Phlegmacium glaucopus]|nr:hypothetical protein BYT27DRAFT_7262778 [Phlegmacium glaucopus]